MNNRKNRKRLILFLVFLIPFLVDFSLTPSWTSYPIIIIIGLSFGHGISLKNQDGFIQAVFLLIVTSLVRFQQYTIFLFKDIGLMLIGIMPFLLNSKFKIDIKKFNILLIGGFIIVIGNSLFHFSFSVNNFVNSSFGIETGPFCYIFALLTIISFRERSYKWFLINCLFTLLGGKRIAMVAVVFGILIDFFLRGKVGMVRNHTKFLIFIITVLYLWITYLFTVGYFDAFIFDLTSKNANSFTMGRQRLYETVFSLISEPNIFGIGSGNTVERLLKLHNATGRMHNDLLKIYSENGIIVYCLFFYYFLRKLRYEQLSVLSSILIIFSTTNSLIYAYMLFIYCLFLNTKDYFLINYNRKHGLLQVSL